MSVLAWVTFSKYRLRMCRYMNECAVCKAAIVAGQEYFDGGYGRRAHIDCCDPDGSRRRRLDFGPDCIIKTRKRKEMQ